jgi:hypothetical protein
MAKHQWNISLVATSIEITFYGGKIEAAPAGIIERKAVPMTDTTARILLFLQSTRHCSEAPPSSLK